MITKLYIDNFKTFVNFEIDFQKINLLIGNNNAGKSNLFDALDFLSSTVSNQKMIYQCIHNIRGSASNFFHKYSKLKKSRFSIHCSIPFWKKGEIKQVDYAYGFTIEEKDTEDLTLRRWIVTNETLSASCEDFTNQILIDKSVEEESLYIYKNDTDLWNTDPEALNQAEFGKPMPMNYTILSSDTLITKNHALALNFKDFLSRIRVFDFETSRLKSSIVEPYQGLKKDGQNLFQALYDMKSKEERYYHQVIELVRHVEPKIEFLNFIKPDDETISVFVEDQNGIKFDKHCLSSGTLRFLAFSYVVTGVELFYKKFHYPLMTLLEEPEAGLFIGHIKTLYKQFQISEGQYIISTHNPYLIDLFDDNLDGVKLLHNDGEKTIIKPINKEKIEKYLDKLPLGEMHFREILA